MRQAAVHTLAPWPHIPGVDAATAYWFPRENSGQGGSESGAEDGPGTYGKGEGPLPRG